MHLQAGGLKGCDPLLVHHLLVVKNSHQLPVYVMDHAGLGGSSPMFIRRDDLFAQGHQAGSFLIGKETPGRMLPETGGHKQDASESGHSRSQESSAIEVHEFPLLVSTEISKEIP